MKHRPTITTGLLALLAATFLVSADARAETLDTAMSRLAGQVAREMKKMDAESIVVGRPDGPPGDAATLRMQRSLVDALDASGVKVTPLAGFKLSMEYSRTNGTSRYSMNVRMRDRQGRSLAAFPANFEFTLTDPADRAVVEGWSVEPGTNDDGEPQKATISRIAEAFEKAAEPVVEAKSVVSARRNGKFHVEVLAKGRDEPGTYRPREMQIVDGRPFAELRPGEIYAVRIVNDADHAVAVDLGIDGVNVWRLSDNASWRRNAKFYVAAKSETTISGWHLTGDTYGEFEVVDYPQALAKRMGLESPSGLGQITALFYAAWKENEAVPAVEAVGAAGPKTDVGRRIDRTTESVRCYYGSSLIGAVTVRYDRPLQ